MLTNLILQNQKLNFYEFIGKIEFKLIKNFLENLVKFKLPLY